MADIGRGALSVAGFRRANPAPVERDSLSWSSHMAAPAIVPGRLETSMVGGLATLSESRADYAMAMVADARLAERGLLRKPRFVTSSNGHTIALYHSDATFRALLDEADIIDADGMPIVLASRFLNRAPIPERIATTDFIHDASQAAAANNVRFFFLGAKPGVAERAAANLRALYPDLQIVGIRDGYFSEEDEPELLEEIVQSGTHVLWLGLGSPRQEAFAVRNRRHLAGLAWIRTCGGLFDHIAGSVPRAPQWMQRIGMEWLFRLMQEPARLGPRYLKTNPLAVFHLLTKTRG